MLVDARLDQPTHLSGDRTELRFGDGLEAIRQLAGHANGEGYEFGGLWLHLLHIGIMKYNLKLP